MLRDGQSCETWIHFGMLSIRYQTYILRYFSSVYPGKGISTRLSFNFIPNGLGSVFNSQQITVFAGHISGIPDCSISLMVSSVLVYWIVISDDNRAPLYTCDSILPIISHWIKSNRLEPVKDSLQYKKYGTVSSTLGVMASTKSEKTEFEWICM